MRTAKARLAAHHLFVRFRRALEREDFSHGPHAANVFFHRRHAVGEGRSDSFLRLAELMAIGRVNEVAVRRPLLLHSDRRRRYWLRVERGVTPLMAPAELIRSGELDFALLRVDQRIR